MNFQKMRSELRQYYIHDLTPRADAFCERCEQELNALRHPDMSPSEMKLLQYRLITERFTPVLFDTVPFYYEMGTMWGQCDGAGEFRGHDHPGGWTYRQNSHLFAEADPALWQLRCAQADELFYLICGPYNDVRQHFCFNHRPVLAMGLKGIYEQALRRAQTATAEQRIFLDAVCEGLLCLKRIAEKFSTAAEARLAHEQDPVIRQNLLRIRKSASRTPWEKPETFYEALNTLAFLRKAVGSLEGIGLNSFGRLDVDLLPFYRQDTEQGTLSQAEAYELICQFLLCFDLHYDHDMKMVLYADHELENTYVLGGCDQNGDPVFNDLTRMFLQATREEGIIYPKIKCRFSSTSPKEYLDEIDRAVIGGTSTVLFQNDDATIPAQVRAGRSLEEARDYIISGCWDISIPGAEKADCGAYVNLLKPFEYAIHRLDEKMKRVGMVFLPLDDAADFEEVYRITCENIRTLLQERSRITRLGGGMWHKVDALPLFSSTIGDCIEKAADFTAGGARYRDDHYLFFGLPNIVDSLSAIRELCFERKLCTLKELLNAVRCNWEGCEELRLRATRCPGFGDGSSRVTALAARLHEDLYRMTQQLTGTYGGKVLLGYLTYTEIRWWGEKTLATPDGRRSGDYFSQGLTPSRLKHIPAVTSVIHTLAQLDASMIGANSVVNIILPSNTMTLDICESFLRTAAGSALQSLQLNCTTREQLLDAQKHPEKYPELIVRVCGFSAKFTSLSPEWQQEVLTRNFYE